jgi:MinD superfamily P-loop ATPase
MCQFNAIISLGKSAMVFPELCHSCGGCEMVCPTHAITETNHKIGIVRKGTKNNIAFSEGLLDIGNAMSPPVIREVKKAVKNSFDLTIIDCPPGTSCPMNEGVKKADFVILVTEPTPFGLYDLNMAVETIKILKIPFAVAINRFDSGDDRVEKYCRKENIKILIKIPDNRKAAEAYSNGNSLISAMPWLKGEFNKIIDTIKADLAAAGRKK